MTRSRTIDVESIVLKMHGAFFMPKNTARPGGLQKGALQYRDLPDKKDSR